MTLAPEKLLVTGEALIPPPGFQAESVVAATYSLDLAGALAVPLALIRNGEFAGQSISDLSRWPILEALERFETNCRIFCDSSALYPPRQNQRLLNLLSQVIVPVAMPKRPAAEGRYRFHPKFILIKFVNADRSEIKLRLVCMSRNLTADTAFDIGVVLDGSYGPKGLDSQRSGALAAFLETLPNRVVAPDRKSRAASIVTDMAKAVRRTRWQPPDGFDAVAFHPAHSGLNGHDPALGRDGEDRLLVISPFLGAGRLNALVRSLSPSDAKREISSILISSRHQLEFVGRRALAKFDRCYEFGADLPDPIEVDDTASSERMNPAQESGLHAKLFVTQAAGRVRWILGSGNATGSGWKGNAELLVELTGSARRWGIDNLLGDRGIAELLVAFDEDMADQDEQIVEPYSRAEALLDELSARTIACHARQADSETFVVSIAVEGEPLILDGADVSFRLPWRGSVSSQFVPSAEPNGLLEGLKVSELPNFLVVSVHADGEKLERVMTVSLAGVDLDEVRQAVRDEEIGKADPLDYIRFFLSGTEADADFVLYVGDDETAAKSGGEPEQSPPHVDPGPILEQILELARSQLRAGSPDRLREFMAIVDAYADRLPKELVDLCVEVDTAFRQEDV